MNPQIIDRYFSTLHRLTVQAAVTDAAGAAMSLSDAFVRMETAVRSAHAAGNKVMFIGNGGSAGICSHHAVDYSKNGGIRSMAFNDGAMLTCLGNDYGYEHVFAKQIDYHGRRGDVLVAISSSGRSANILNGVCAARAIGCEVVTLSGFAPDNPLRRAGDINVYIESFEYGFVELAHTSMLHALLDLAMGWGTATAPTLAETAAE
ncbi:SIS domain-containing protein [Azospirillum halopraeferens]|uniref:SIS domain-containing protein n=1 Tax=Azospirillum halopraeferens TaxID=34010 RepID=UPI00042A77CA|nr:SIS domain-containing protein [Azospirillum halopraeferens]